MKKKYEPLEYRVIRFECEAVLGSSSGFSGEEDDFTKTISIQSDKEETIKTKVNPT